MREKFLNFIQQPSLESFMDLRQEVLADEAFDPYSRELDDIDILMEGDKWEQVIETIFKALRPNYLLSPHAHMNLAFAHQKLGREKDAEVEQMLAFTLMDGIKSTGDGTPERPYLVTRTSDEYDLLMSEGLHPSEQALMTRDGRDFDVLKTREGKELWFDVTDIKAILDRRFGG